MNKKTILLISFVVFLFIIISGFILYLFLPNNKSVKIFPAEETSLIIEGELVEAESPPIIEENQILLPLETVKKYLDDKVFWDEKTKKVIVTTHDKVIKLVEGKVVAVSNDTPIDIKTSVKIISNKVYMPINFLEDVYRIDTEINKKLDLVVIEKRDTIKRIAEVISKKAYVRKGMSIKEPIVKRLKEKDSLRVFDEYEKWYKVRTTEGYLGYIEKKNIKITALTSSIYNEYKEQAINPPAKRIINGKINLVWDYIESRTHGVSNEPKIQGLDVVSPTWFRLEKGERMIDSLANFKYIEWAKLNGYSVWPLFSNQCDTQLTSKILNDSSLREKLIDELLVYVKLYKLEGINVDFENMNIEDKDVYSQFIRELAPAMRQQGVILSVDVGIPGGSENWSLCYDRKALSDAADYIMVMTYDQHYESGDNSGSIAQLAWVEGNIKKTLNEVPASKLFLGLPFYTRVWKEEMDPEGKKIINLTSIALTMDEVKKRIKKNNATIEWDEESGQYYAEYKKDNSVYKIWVENERSINLKASLVHKYQLAGAASWQKGFETKEIWQVLNKSLKKDVNYTEWAKANTENKDKDNRF